jgi:hypothetical protein
VGERIIEDRRDERPGMTASMSFSMEDGMVVVEDDWEGEERERRWTSR